MKQWFNALPTEVQIAIYVGFSGIIATLIANVQNFQAIDWRAVLIVALTTVANLIAYQVLKLKG